MNCFIFESVYSPGIEGNFACSFHFVQVLLFGLSMYSFEFRCQSNETRATSTTAHFISIETLILCYFIHVVLMIF